MPVVKIALLFFAALGFAGMGAALAIGRMRALNEGDPDVGMRALALVLGIFSASCTISATGVSGVLAFGGVVVWCSYVLCAQHMGVFRVEYVERREGEPASR